MLKGKSIRALGTMSGTSLDGVDAAVVVTDGITIEAFGESSYRPYSAAERDTLRTALGQWHDGDVAQAAEVVETAHAQLLSKFDAADLIGFHGQTLAHDPSGRGTHQAGDGCILAEVLQTPVVWDFRSADVRFGGEGAPLAPFFHFALAKWIKARAPLCFLNLGGVGNLTWVDPSFDAPETPGALLAFDTGPANAPLNDLMRARRGQDYDENGALAATAFANGPIISRFLQHSYFYKMPPKSLDRDAFSTLQNDVATHSDAEAAATLTAAIAFSVSEGLKHCPQAPSEILITGGGRHNDTLMKMLDALLPCAVKPVEDYDLNGDMLEAQAFAFLAVRVANGLPTSCPATTGVRAAVSGGTLSKPG